MVPAIIKASEISDDQSVVCILGSDEIPEWLKLGESEIEFARKQLPDKENHVYINSRPHEATNTCSTESPP